MMDEFFFSEQPVSIQVGNNKHKHKYNKINKKQQKNAINYEEKQILSRIEMI